MATDRPRLYLGNLCEEEGNAWVMLGRARAVALEEGMDWEAISADAKSGDYQHLIDVLDEHFDTKYTGGKR